MNVVALGADAELVGFVLAGVDVVPAGSDEEIRRAWRALGGDVGLVVLSSHAADVLGGTVDERPDVLTVVAP